jgi:hypothetical protein
MNRRLEREIEDKQRERLVMWTGDTFTGKEDLTPSSWISLEHLVCV